MTMPGDLASLFGGAPPGSSQDLRYRQGVILTFDPITLSNTVDVGGAVLTDLPVLGVGEATLFVPGAIVGLATIGVPGRGQTLAILGRIVRPNTADAASAISLLSARIYADEVGGSDSTNSAAFGDLSASFGPTLTDVIVGPSGRLLVFSSCTFNYGFTNASLGGEMSFQYTDPSGTVSGPVVFDGRGPTSHLQASGVGVTALVIDGKTRHKLLTGLTPGSYLLEAKYRSTVGGVACNFSNRTMAAFAL